MFNRIQLFALLAGAILVSGYKYVIKFRDDKMFVPCPGFENYYVTKFFQLPQTMQLLPQDILYINGNLTVVYNYDPNKLHQLHFELYKRRRGTWQRSLFSRKREDFCLSAFNPREEWYEVTAAVPVEQRKCPFVKGQIFTFDYKTQLILDRISNRHGGEYWARFEQGSKYNPEEYFCVDTFYSLNLVI